MSKSENNFMVFALLSAAMFSACSESEVKTGSEPAAMTDSAKPNHEAPAVTFAPADEKMQSASPAAPVSISYRIIGQPVVGQPVAIDLRVSSSLQAMPISLGYGIKDATAISLAEAQPTSVNLPAPADGATRLSQVRVIPLREGRFYLNVSASFETEAGSVSTVTAIPIQVGDGKRELQSNGTLQTDADGEAIRVLPADGN